MVQQDGPGDRGVGARSAASSPTPRWGSATPSSRAQQPIDFFVSYSPADERWATWLAWQLETAGYRTLIQAWDFVPGTNFIDFMDRGIRESTVVLAVLSRNYLQSRYGTMEWQATLRTDPGKLMTVRIEDCRLEGLLATITYLDLVDVPDAETAGRALHDRVRHVLAGRAKPGVAPAFPIAVTESEPLGVDAPTAGQGVTVGTSAPLKARRTPVAAPAFPRGAPNGRNRDAGITVLHVSGPRFGRGLAGPDEPLTARDLQSRIWANVTELTDQGVPRPDLIVVTGDLTESARPKEIDEALEFLTGLRVLLGLEPDRLIVVPGNRDASKPACVAYFAGCEARDRQPQPPYFPKLEHFSGLFDELYQGLDDLVFDVAQPWTLFAVPELRVAVAGLNSTMAATHRPEDNYGQVGETQAAWFAERLRPFEEAGWLRIGVMRHDPVPGSMAEPNDPDLLRDAATLGRLVGRRLNFLVHGPGPGGRYVDLLSDTLPVLPATGPGRDEIIQVTADGLVRFSAYDQRPLEQAERYTRAWHATDAAFPPRQPESTAEQFVVEAPEPLDPMLLDAPPETPAPESSPLSADPHDRLLERVTEVCATRYDGAKIRRVAADPPHLLVTRKDENVTPQWRIAVHVGDLNRAVVEDFLAHDPGYGAELVYQGKPPEPSLRDEAARRGLRLRSFTEFQGLLDLEDYLDRQTARLRTDRRYPPDLYVPQRFRELDRNDHTIHDDLADQLVRLVSVDHGRFVLVLGDFGRGKTFVLREVARRIAETMPYLVPILIELRALDKAHSVDGLVAAHLANHGEDRIDLKAFHYMLREGRVVLLFDGFDELVTRVTYERAADHLETLLAAAQDKAKIIVASRTQHFKSRSQVLTALGERVGLLPQRRILGIEDFTPAQIRAYLVNRYGGDERRADERMRLLNGIQDLLSLCRNPRMLSFIADLDGERLRAAAGARQAISAAGLYREILQSWLAYEADRVTVGSGGPTSLGLDEQWAAVTVLALRMWETGESYLRLAELSDVAETLVKIAGISRMSAQHVAHAMGAGSLLVRTEDDLFGFIHSSVAEWLVANMICGQFGSGVAAPPQLSQRPLSQLTVDFLCDLADTRACRAWAEGALADADADPVSRTNAIKVSTRLRTPPTADLRGASLQGEDLSYRNLREVDLTGADLTGARLVGADLRRAVLRDATLVAARLDEAQLAGADLRGANLTRARFAKADFTGARVVGSRWTRAALVDSTGVPDAVELRDAAIVPGSPVGTAFAPAAVGVRHGFHAQHGRLPQVLGYSPDGGTLAIGSDDGGVLICDTATGAPVRTLQGHRGRVFAVAYGERVLVTGSNDGTVRLWDAATGEQRRVIREHQDWPWPVVIGPAGDVLATGDADGVLRIWDLPAGSPRHECPADRGLIYSLAFLGRQVAVSYRDGTVRLWDVDTGSPAGELTGARGAVFRVAFSPSGEWLATGGDGGTLALWDPASCTRIRELAGHTGRVYTLAFHPRAPILASGDTDGGVRLWDASTGEPRHALVGHDTAVYWVAFDPTGELLATGDRAGLVCLWDSESGELRRTLSSHTGSVWPFAFHPDGGQLAISDDQFTTRLWDPVSGQCRHTLTGHGRQVSAVRFNADGSLLATCGNDGIVRLWDPVNGRQVRKVIGREDRLLTLETAIFDPARPDRLATVSNDGRLNLLDLTAGRHERHINVESAPIWAVAFGPTGDTLATANDDDTVSVWYRNTGGLRHTFGEHRGRVRSVAYNVDGSLIATGCDDSVVRLWDGESGRLIRELRGHTDRVYAVAFHDDLLASASWDRTARIWDVASGRLRHELVRHTGRLWTAAVNPRDGVLATAGDDLVIRLWDMASGRHLHTLEGHTRSVWSVAFNPSGELLASGGDDGTAMLWSMTEDKPAVRTTLLGLPEGWAALAPDGRYKFEGDNDGQFWYVVGMSRFEPGELDPYLPEVRQIPLEAPF